MSLTAGTRLGPYEIQSALGAGGMGEVYRARDTRLDRTVAVKVLPETLASDTQFRERFEREARTLATLSHPHICQVFDVGRHEGVDFLVMEYLEGETLAERVEPGARGPGLRLDEALPIAVQIVDALVAAHRAGIVHRDLKPANIFLVRQGRSSGPPLVKLLDFGLAKAAAPAVAGGLSALPTTPRGLTQQGTILGTFQYMAPEQVEGQEADARSDLFAFGCVLYEMVTGRRAFEGKTAASVMAAILEREPPSVRSLQPLAPPLLDHIVGRCLAKSPDERWQTASDLLQELKWAAADGSSAVNTIAASAPRAGRRLWLSSAAAGLLIGAVTASVLWTVMRPEPQGPRPVARLRVDLPDSARGAVNSGVTVSRDGRTFLYSALGDDGVSRLYARQLARLESTVIRGTENAQNPALSPDAAWVAFVADGQLKKVALGGGPPIVLCDVPAGVFGTDWSTENAVVFGGPDGVARVPAAGGKPEVVVKVDGAAMEAGHRWPRVLPDGRTVVFTIWFGAAANAQVAIASLETGERRTLVQGAYPRVTSSGQLLFTRVRSLWTVPLDPRQLRVVGEPVPVLEDVQTQISGLSMYDLAADGTLVYRQAGAAGRFQRLVWFSRNAGTTPAVNEQLAGIYHPVPRLSPDGRLLAVTTHPEGGDDQVVIYDLDRGIRSPLDAGPRVNSRYPTWSPDGARLAFASTTAGTWDIYSMAATGAGKPEPLLVGPDDQTPMSWSPDGRVLAFVQPGRPSGFDIWMLPRGGAPSVFLATQFDERDAAFSPDGRWLAFISNESGRYEVYVAPYPGPGAKVRVSTSGGTEPVWARDGTELFYRESERNLMAVRVQSRPTLTLGKPVPLAQVQLYDEPGGPNYDVAPDGRRFIAIENPNSAPPSLVVVQNWLQELAQKVPAKPE
ncbi:MAG: serine/threonine-protein kinase [Acidobacteria bacterium]|nr:serine/threonine-protein kinase [Acidobacteriota bacterium]